MGDAWPRRPWMRGRTERILEASRRLRSEMTPAETALWKALRQEGIPGMRFRRQHAIGRFILDFYCPQYRLAVELDGSVHDGSNQREYDAARSEALEQLGIRVLRFRNEEVMQNLPSVLDRIKEVSIPDEYRKTGDLD
ncbi:MAG TPA: endonuclease domain-containing protein [Longimicrobium sp.]|nr:endonuclease domain-containing protein [Longimicrobium sp.]